MPWMTGTVTIAVKPVTASLLPTTARLSPMPQSTNIPSPTSTAAPEASLTRAQATAKTLTTHNRGLSGMRLEIIVIIISNKSINN